MNIPKFVLAALLLSSTQVAFSMTSAEKTHEKQLVENIKITQNYAKQNGKDAPEIIDYKYGIKMDISKLIHQTKDLEICGPFKKVISYEDSQGALHSVRYTKLGDCGRSQG